MIYDDSLARGLKIIPLPPREKSARLKDWQKLAVCSASIMVGAPPDANYGCVADNTFCILDVDALEAFHREITVRLPQTYTVATKRGAHYYMRHSVASRRLGNKAGGIFDFMALDKYVVGAGSTHPSGRIYEVVDASPIVDIPDAVTMALTKFTKIRKQRRAANGEKHEDREDMLRYLGRSDVFNGVRDESELLELLIARNEEQEVQLSLGDLIRMVKWAVEHWDVGAPVVKFKSVKTVRRYR